MALSINKNAKYILVLLLTALERTERLKTTFEFTGKITWNSSVFDRHGRKKKKSTMWWQRILHYFNCCDCCVLGIIGFGFGFGLIRGRLF